MTIVVLSAASSGAASGRAAVSIIYPASLAALQAIWTTIPAMSTNDKLTFLNNIRVPGPPQDVPRTELKKVVDGAGTSLRAYVANPAGANLQALIAANYLLALIGYEATYSDTLQTSNPAIFALVGQVGPSLLMDPATGVTQDLLSRMTALITPLVPWWRMNGFAAPVNVMDLVHAGNLY